MKKSSPSTLPRLSVTSLSQYVRLENCEHFPDLAVTDSIDTVERFQGGERDVIIVSATASDPDYVLAEADFLLNLNRLNVALSRPRKKLIVVASRSVIDLLAPTWTYSKMPLSGNGSTTSMPPSCCGRASGAVCRSG